MFRPTIYGEARWKNAWEKRAYFSYKNKGVYLSQKHRLSLSDSYKNLCLIAPTGSGKTTRYVIPNILQCRGNVVVTDPSGEIHALTHRAMERRGYRVQVLQPANLKESLQFNPLAMIQDIQGLKRIATILGRNNAGSGDDFWITGATNLIYLCLQACQKGGTEELHIGRVRDLLNELGADEQATVAFMRDRLETKAYREFLAFLAQDEKVISNVLSSARAALESWSDPDIETFTQSHTIDLHALRNKKTIIYVIIPEDKIRYFSTLVTLFYSACFELCLNTPGNPVFFFLDEFGNLGKVGTDFASMITTLRKRHCSISIILQELSQLTSVYGVHEAKAIYSGGCANKLFFSGLDHETARMVSQQLGETTQSGVITDDRNTLETRTVTVGKPLLTPDQVRMLGDDEAVLLSGSKRPVKLNMKPYFQDRYLKNLTNKK